MISACPEPIICLGRRLRSNGLAAPSSASFTRCVFLASAALSALISFNFFFHFCITTLCPTTLTPPSQSHPSPLSPPTATALKPLTACPSSFLLPLSFRLGDGEEPDTGAGADANLTREYHYGIGLGANTLANDVPRRRRRRSSVYPFPVYIHQHSVHLRVPHVHPTVPSNGGSGSGRVCYREQGVPVNLAALDAGFSDFSRFF
ncbi:hypothetical protein JB92DRAFT_3122601 [Gautieria morchelliformis]|nr:hypothetical protein JB92DRAFT_3122601 [Gautieria morchelliformis]